ncbi:FxsA family protein [Rhodobacter calidifons]|uniref:FxsA family protein n=1 Tax=Rhodobacter calidifons TaxID=2715277 RepID=A0ABX0G454_9RHOB|nr:FxsA family protein [Rhodobacter calidifons]NHB76001.1 FxsA family protein [Rhodobacter calidifons]
MAIILAILALPLVEIALFVTLGARLGLWLTLAWVLLTAMGGMLILRRLAASGMAVRREEFVEGFRGRMAEDPLSPVVDQALIAVAAMLLILPGFFTDALGLLLLVPPLRRLGIGLMARRVRGVTVVHRHLP